MQTVYGRNNKKHTKRPYFHRDSSKNKQKMRIMDDKKVIRLVSKGRCSKANKKLSTNIHYNRSSHQSFSVKKGALKNFTNFTEKTPLLESLFYKIAGS